MVVQFHRQDEGYERPGEDPATVNSLPQVPRQLLDRHGARVLSPAEAVIAAGWPVPRSSVYRAATLLIPGDILRDPANLDAIDRVLAEIGLRTERRRGPKEAADDDTVDAAGRGNGNGLDRLPRAVVLVVKEGSAPTVVDAWAALQRLRAATAGEKPVLDRKLVARITVEHLLFATVNIGGTPWEASGSPDGFAARSRRNGRVPVSLAADAPPRRALAPGKFDRRPVVAVLDTGIGPHPWFELADRSVPPPPSSSLTVVPALQQAILDNATYPAGFTPTQLLNDFWDGPDFVNPLVGDINRDTGHGTFIAGVIRQEAPSAEVLAIRVLHTDGVAYEGDVALALWYLGNEVNRAQLDGKPERMIDVVSLSLGYYDESAVSAYTGQLAGIIDWLTGMGVLVLAAAGNDATTRRFYPSALADRPVTPGSGPQVISVGALNPNGSKALFSNEAPWVRAWATGASVVSTFPTDVQGAQTPGHDVVDRDRQEADDDNYKGGFAVWDGTSFAAPLAAATVANALIDTAEANPALSLGTVQRTVTVDRAWAALKNLP